MVIIPASFAKATSWYHSASTGPGGEEIGKIQIWEFGRWVSRMSRPNPHTHACIKGLIGLSHPRESMLYFIFPPHCNACQDERVLDPPNLTETDQLKATGTVEKLVALAIQWVRAAKEGVQKHAHPRSGVWTNPICAMYSLSLSLSLSIYIYIYIT